MVLNMSYYVKKTYFCVDLVFAMRYKYSFAPLLNFKTKMKTKINNPMTWTSSLTSLTRCLTRCC